MFNIEIKMILLPKDGKNYESLNHHLPSYPFDPKNYTINQPKQIPPVIDPKKITKRQKNTELKNSLLKPKPLQKIDLSTCKHKTYNVVCAIALANYQRNYTNGEWCELMYYQNQNIALIGCMIINKQHPTGIMKYFSPTPKPPTQTTTKILNS